MKIVNILSMIRLFCLDNWHYEKIEEIYVSTMKYILCNGKTTQRELIENLSLGINTS